MVAEGAWSLLKSKLLVSFLVVLGVTCSCVVTIRSLSTLGALDDGLRGITEQGYPKLMVTTRIIKRAIDNGRLSRSAILLDDAREVEEKIREIESQRLANTEDIATLRMLDVQAGDASVMARIVAVRESLTAKYKRLYELLRAGDDDKSREFLFADLAPANKEYVLLLEQISAEQDRKIAEAGALAESSSQSARNMLIAAIALSAFAGGVLLWPAVSGIVSFLGALRSTSPGDPPGW